MASREDLLEAYRLSVRADPISAVGGIVAFNRPVDEALAKEIREFRSPTDGDTRMFYEIVIAPGYTPAGLECLKVPRGWLPPLSRRLAWDCVPPLMTSLSSPFHDFPFLLLLLPIPQGKSKTLRILEAAPRVPGGRSMRQIGGGWLLQQSDMLRPEDVTFTSVGATPPTAEQLEELRFAWRVVKHVKSNAITVAKGGRLLGMGSGQVKRRKGEKYGRGREREPRKSPATLILPRLALPAFPPAQPRQLDPHRPREGRGGGLGRRPGLGRLLPLRMGGQRGARLPGRHQGHRAPGGVHPGPGRGGLLQQVRRGHRHDGGAALQALG